VAVAEPEVVAAVEGDKGKDIGHSTVLNGNTKYWVSNE
jgi:hypothetical protein